jgi:dTDP-L-rhamnose 4-epimerase
MDGDGSLDPRDLHRVVDSVRSGRADLVVGSRVPRPGAWPVHARIGNRLLAAAVRRRFGLPDPLTDLGPMRAVRRGPLLQLGLRDRRFGWPLEMVVRALAAGWEVRTVPVPYRPRSGGQSKVTGSLMGTVRATVDSARVLRWPSD